MVEFNAGSWASGKPPTSPVVGTPKLPARDGQTPGEIAEAIGVEGPTVVRALQRMDAAGIVVRKKHPTDGRQVVIHLTAAGRKLRTHLPRALKRVEEDAFVRFSKTERAQLLELLERVSTNLTST